MQISTGKRVLFFVVGLYFLLVDYMAIDTGKFKTSRRMRLEFTVAHDPIIFWTLIVLLGVAAAFMLFLAIVGRGFRL